MKTFEVDAKQLIRNYVESIEEYLRNHTRLHPNEIDSLLNEINDFVYIRSRELTTGERVGYSSVLKAIEECGSPSEISEQYLDLEHTDASGSPSNEEISFSPLINPAKKGNEELNIQEDDKKNIIMTPSKQITSFISINSLKNSYKNAPAFTIYRICFSLLISIQIFGFILNLPTENFFPYDNYLPSQIVPLFFFNSLAYDICLGLTVYAVLLILLECWIIQGWKSKLVKENRINRFFDDKLIIWLSRIGFLVLFLKSSLIYASAYIYFTPIWIILAITVEKSLNSQLWENRLSSGVSKIGMILSGNEQSEANLSDRIKLFRSNFSNEELGIAIIPSILLILSFIIVPFTLISDWGILVGLSVLGMVVTLSLIIYFQFKNPKEENPDEVAVFQVGSELIAWIFRIVALKTIITAATLYRLSGIGIYFYSFIILIWIVSEFFLNSKSMENIKYSLGEILLQLSASKSPSVNSEIQMDVTELNKNSSSSEISSTIKTTSTVQPNSGLAQQDHQGTSTPTLMDVKTNDLQKKESFWLFRFISAIMKAVVMTISMLIVTIFEVALIFTTFLTYFTEYGSYRVHSFVFDTTYWNIPENIIPTGSYVIPSFTIYVWHALLLLAIQVFIIALLEYYGTAIKKPEGVVVFLGRNASRLLISIMFIGSIIRLINSGNNYILLELMLLSIFLVFNEVNAWKVRSERKTWEKENTVFQPNNEINEEVSQAHPGTS